MSVKTSPRLPCTAAPAPDAATLSVQMQANAEAAAALLKALANPQRLRVLCVLLEGERSVGQINEEIDLSQSALSQHLAVLRAEGLVATRRAAQTVHYSLLPGAAHDILQVLHYRYCAPEGGSRKKRPR